MDRLHNIMEQALTSTVKNDFNIQLLYSQNTKQLVFGKDGVGKSFFSTYQQLNFCIDKDIVPVYLDGDAKSSKQKAFFANLYKEHNGLYLNYKIWKEDKARRAGLQNTKKLSDSSFYDFIEIVIQFLLEETDKKYFIVIDNFTLLIKGNENDTKEVGRITSKLNQLFDNERLSITLIAHSGKDESKGVRGSNILQSIFGQILYLNVDVDNNRYLSVQKDSMGNLSGKSMLYYVALDKENGFVLEPTDDKIISKDMLMYYKEKKLMDLTYFILLKLKRINVTYINIDSLEQTIMLIGGQYDYSDKKYLSPSFIHKNIKAILIALNAEVIKMKVNNKLRNMISLENIDENLLELTDISEYDIENIVADIIYKNIDNKNILINNEGNQPEDSIKLKQYRNDFIELLSAYEEGLTTQELRDMLYVKRDKDKMKDYSKYFARNMFGIILKELTLDNIVSVQKDGRKKVFTLNK